MRAIQRWRYYCDFCKKSGMSKGHMVRHEASCTLNPARHCKMCDLIEGDERALLSELMAMLPEPAQHMHMDPNNFGNNAGPVLNDEAIKPLIAAALPLMRVAVSGCPVCIMAAMRQKKIPVPLAEDFKFKDEMKALFVDINDAREGGRYY